MRPLRDRRLFQRGHPVNFDADFPEFVAVRSQAELFNEFILEVFGNVVPMPPAEVIFMVAVTPTAENPAKRFSISVMIAHEPTHV